MVEDTRTESVPALLATNLRRLRIARHLSLSELARATGMSKATLSSIENGRANPTVETLAALAGALRIGLPALLEDLPLGDIRVVRSASARRHSRDGFPHRLLDEIEAGGQIQLAEIELPGSTSHEAAPKPKGSRAHVFVLSGKLITGPVERSTELATGDYASFPADVPHVYETGRDLARALVMSQLT